MTRRKVICAGPIVWVPTPNRNYWAEWQFSPAGATYTFLGWVGNDRLAFALGRIAGGANPNGN